MADRTYVATIKESSGNWLVSVFRDPATEPVDNTSPSGATAAHVSIPWLQGQGFNGPNSDGGHNVANVTGATNAAPIVVTMDVTAASLGIAAGDVVNVKSVGGNTNANGTFEVTSVSGSTVTLKGSAGNAAYTSGGKIYKVNKAQTLKIALEAVQRAVANDKAQVG